MLLVLLHDFPEFLCDYHLSFCDVIPPTCVQLRNLVLSAFPRSMRLPDPFTPNLKVDLLPEIAQSPRVLTDYMAALTERGIRQRLDLFIQNKQPPDLPSLLPAALIGTSPSDTPLPPSYYPSYSPFFLIIFPFIFPSLSLHRYHHTPIYIIQSCCCPCPCPCLALVWPCLTPLIPSPSPSSPPSPVIQFLVA